MVFKTTAIDHSAIPPRRDFTAKAGARLTRWLAALVSRVPTCRLRIYDETPGMNSGFSIGLCADCQHAERITSSRATTFYMCRLSLVDPRYPKYPRLPVLTCEGYKRTNPPRRGSPVT